MEGRVALITGTGGGQGRAASLRFAEEGAIVVGCDVDAESSEETVRRVTEAGGRITATAPVDLGDSAAAGAWVDRAAADHGGIDILYNNAGATRFGLIRDMPDEDWDFTLRNEVSQLFFVTRAAWPYLAESEHASIINVASMQGFVALNHVRGGAAHALTKHGIVGYTREMAAEGSQDGIRVNSISPGMIVTPVTAPMIEGNQELVEGFLNLQMIKRLGRPEDVVGPALFLASDDSAFMTGANLMIDGGYTAV